MTKLKYFLVILIIITPVFLFAQRKKDRIELVQADILEGRGKGVRVLKGNVVFRQDGTLMYTDSAYFYPRKNALDAFGNVRIVQPDGGTITSKKLFYDGDTKLAKFRENVILREKTSTVFTDALNYNMEDKTAQYSQGATINDPPNTLTSVKGFYNSNTKIFDFKENVKVVNEKEDFILYSEHLLYNSETKIATFLAPSTIISKGDTVYAKSGTYNTISDVADLDVSTIKSGDYVLSGDIVNYNKQLDRGTVSGNVKMVSEKDDVVIFGNKAIHRGDLGYTKVFGEAVMIKEMEDDSLFLSADTLVSIDRKEAGEKKLLAYDDTKVFKEDLQAVADSLVYNFSDSLISFYTSPVLWNLDNQISADTIRIQLANDKLDMMFLRQNSFIISKDTLDNYNQVKGRDMDAWFKNDSIQRVDVNGNSQSIYFVLEGDTGLTGMNRVESSNMRMIFKDNKVSTISFLNNPEGRFVPPHLLQEPEKRLKGFKWWSERRPTKAIVLRQNL